jgi:hypothetical protein
MKVSSSFAILDIKTGRKKLLDKVKSEMAAYDSVRIPVTITGFIDGEWGRDDGTSIEFSVLVTKVEISS